MTAAPLEDRPGYEDIATRAFREVERFLGRQREAVDEDTPDARSLIAEYERLLHSGGKMLRPVFCCAGYVAAGHAVDDPIIRVGSALELLHLFALLHDDVMDRSERRRGEWTAWKHAAERSAGGRGDPEAFGIAFAILAGDLAGVLADQAFLASGFPPDRLLSAKERYDRMRTGVIAGQFLDVRASHRGAAEEEEARRIAYLKSGGYTVHGPLEIGAILGGGSRELLACLARYGIPLGEAFQLRDDVLGLFGDPQVTGKDRESDLREGKRTVLVAKALAAAAPEDRAFLDERLGAPTMSDADVDRARRIIETSGALAATEELIDDLVGTARGAIDPAVVPQAGRTLLLDLAEVVADRHR